jgi:phasin
MATPRKPMPKTVTPPPAPAINIAPRAAAPATADVVAAAVAEVMTQPAAVVPPAVPVDAAATAAMASKSLEAVMSRSTETALAGVEQGREVFRQAVEKAIEQGRTAYAKMKDSAEETTVSLETSYAAANSGIGAFNALTIDAWKAHADNAFEHLKALTGARNLPEIVAMQAALARKQMEMFAAQSKDLAILAQKIATETAEPIKTVIVKRLAA